MGLATHDGMASGSHAEARVVVVVVVANSIDSIHCEEEVFVDADVWTNGVHACSAIYDGLFINNSIQLMDRLELLERWLKRDLKFKSPQIYALFWMRIKQTMNCFMRCVERRDNELSV